MTRASTVLLTALALAAAPAASAQTADYGSLDAPLPTAVSIDATRLFEATPEQPSRSAPAAALPLPSYGGWVGVTKWVTLATATGLGTLGFVLHRKASDKFDTLERRCSANPDTCRELNPDGSYADPELEALYQDIVDRDNQARLSLIAAEVSFGLSVLLFIVDFQRDQGPQDIPYHPDDGEQRLRLSIAPGQLTARYYIH